MATNLPIFEQQQEFSEFCEQLICRQSNLSQLFTGSSFELPLIYFIENLTDLDNIRYRRNVCAIKKDTTAPEDFKGTVLIIQTEGSHPGHARLYFKDNDMLYTYAMVPENRPAFSMVLLQKSDISNGSFPDSSKTSKWLATFQELSCDTVDAIWCPNWPEEANEWKLRERPNGWPQENTVNNIVDNGGLLVAKPHQGSRIIAYEWRFSFSKAELILIHTWTDVQMYIYHILRLIKSDIVRKCGGKKMTVLTTYHFKTLMLWACEKRPVEFWLPENIESSVKALLIVIIKWLRHKQCRNYFMPDNNMLDHLPDDHNFERELRFLSNSLDLVDEYISNTIPFTSDRKSKGLKEFPVRIPTNLLFAVQLRVRLWYIVHPSKPGRQMHIPRNAIENSHLFRSYSFLLFQCLAIHRHLILSNNLEEKISRFRDVEECFIRVTDKEIPGFVNVYISPMDTFHDVLKKALSNIDNSSGNYPITECNDRQDKSLVLPRTSARWQLCYSRIENHAACVLEMFFNIMNRQLLKPSCFHTAAYEANFYWTIFGEDGSEVAVKSYKKALDICNKWISHAITINDSLPFMMFYSLQELPVIISNRWSMIFDKYIQIVLGFLSLIKAITSSRLQSKYKPSNTSTDFQVNVHVYPIDLLGYIRYQCTFHMKNDLILDDSFTDDMHNEISRVLLYTAARISTETG